MKEHVILIQLATAFTCPGKQYKCVIVELSLPLVLLWKKRLFLITAISKTTT